MQHNKEAEMVQKICSFLEGLSLVVIGFTTMGVPLLILRAHICGEMVGRRTRECPAGWQWMDSILDFYETSFAYLEGMALPILGLYAATICLLVIGGGGYLLWSALANDYVATHRPDEES